MPHPAGRLPRLWARALGMGLLLALHTGCYEFRSTALSVPPVTDARTRTSGSFFWGLVKNNALPIDCNGGALSNVTVHDNLGFSLINVATLGIVNLKRVEVHCAPVNPGEGHLSAGPAGPASGGEP
jgi:hypothetical protein